MSQNLEALLSDLSEFHRNQLLGGMMKSIAFWGNKQADRFHDLEHKFEIASVPEAPVSAEKVDHLRERMDAEMDSLVALRKLYKALAKLAAE